MTVESEQSAKLSDLLASPFAGFAPWIAMSVVEGPSRFELAAILAFALALLTGVLGAAIGMRPKLLDLVAIAFFGALIAVGLAVDESGLHWLGRWSGELSNGVIALAALLSLATGRPFTLQYARETVDRQQWDSPGFVRINLVLTWVWTSAFAIIAVVGYIGDGPLDQPDNIWTNWIIQIAVIVLATKFTEWYPDYVKASTAIEAGDHAESAPSVRPLLVPLAGYAVTVGIVLLAVGGTPFWMGTALIVIGGFVTRWLQDGRTPVTHRSAVERG